MDKGPVCWVHQADDRVVDRGGKANAFDEVWRVGLKPVEQRDLRRSGGVVAEKHPEVPLRLAYRVAVHPDAVGAEGLTRHQRRDRRAMPAGIEAPAVIAALNLIPIEAAGGERHAAMRTE